MITLMLILIGICAIGLIVLIIGGLLTVLWPIALILVIGIIIDVLVFKKLIGK